MGVASAVKLGSRRAPSLTTTLLLVGLNAWTASSMPGLRPLVFLNKFLNLQKLDVLCPGRFVSWTFRYWTFGNWTFCILDVLYPGCSVTGRLVTGRFVTGRYVTGRYVTGRFVGEPFRKYLFRWNFFLCLKTLALDLCID
jgi:hypothetical protein